VYILFELTLFVIIIVCEYCRCFWNLRHLHSWKKSEIIE